MAKKTKGIQISEQLHYGIVVEKLALAVRKKNPNVTFQEVLEDVFVRVALFDYLMIELAERQPETQAWIDEILKEDFYGDEFRQYVKELMEADEVNEATKQWVKRD